MMQQNRAVVETIDTAAIVTMLAVLGACESLFPSLSQLTVRPTLGISLASVQYAICLYQEYR